MLIFGRWRQGTLDNEVLKVKMKKGIKIGLTTALSIVTTLLFVLTIYRRTWGYNKNGNYFDEDSMTTHNDNAIIAYGTLAVIFLIPTLILLNSFRKAPSRQRL